MSASQVAARYAKAFVDALHEKGRLDDSDALQEFIGMVERTPELNGLFQNVAIQPTAKAKVLEATAKTLNLPEMVTRFLLVLASRRRLNLLSEIKIAVANLVDERKNIRAVDLITASPVSDGEIKAFSQALGRSLGAEIRVNPGVDPEILGGAVARVGSLVYDGSVRGQLARLRRQLVKES